MIEINIDNLHEQDILKYMEELSEEMQKRQFVKPSKHFDKKLFDKKFNELLENTPTKFACRNGLIVLRKELVKNILITIRHLTQELDIFMLFVGKEGSGKSLFVRQVNYVFWYLMRELGLIDYTYDLDLVHFGIKELQEDRRQWDLKEKLYRLSILDESKDDLGRDKHMTPEAKSFVDYMRRCREECGIHSYLMPQLSEFMPKLTLSRAVFIFEVDYDIDKITFEVVRGEYTCYTIPRGRKSYSLFHNKELYASKIKSELANYLYTNKRQFEGLPQAIISFKGTFNTVDPIETKAYKEKKRIKKWERQKRKEEQAREVNKLRIMAEDFRALMISLKGEGEPNTRLGERIGKSEATIRNYLKYFESSKSQSET